MTDFPLDYFDNDCEFYTDYPFPAFGDEPNSDHFRFAPMRRLEILDYDGDKYCKVRVFGMASCDDGEHKPIIKDIKAGYIFKRMTYTDVEEYLYAKERG